MKTQSVDYAGMEWFLHPQLPYLRIEDDGSHFFAGPRTISVGLPIEVTDAPVVAEGALKWTNRTSIRTDPCTTALVA